MYRSEVLTLTPSVPVSVTNRSIIEFIVSESQITDTIFVGRPFFVIAEDIVTSYAPCVIIYSIMFPRTSPDTSSTLVSSIFTVSR